MTTKNWITQAEIQELMDKAETGTIGNVGKDNFIFHPKHYEAMQKAGIIDYDGYWVMPKEAADDYE